MTQESTENNEVLKEELKQESIEPELMNSDAGQDSVETSAEQDVVSEEAAPEETIESLKAALAAAELRVKDEALRAQAEIQNIRRRTERDVESAHKFGQEKLVKELLVVVDSLERGIQSIDEQGVEVDPAVKVIRDGSDLTVKLFIDTLAKFQIKQIDPTGEPFDPQFHEAVSAIPSPDAEPNSVIAVVQKGYTLHDRLVRPAMVVVSKA